MFNLIENFFRGVIGSFREVRRRPRHEHFKLLLVLNPSVQRVQRDADMLFKKQLSTVFQVVTNHPQIPQPTKAYAHTLAFGVVVLGLALQTELDCLCVRLFRRIGPDQVEIHVDHIASVILYRDFLDDLGNPPLCIFRHVAHVLLLN